jgi:hypothetical protein
MTLRHSSDRGRSENFQVKLERVVQRGQGSSISSVGVPGVLLVLLRVGEILRRRQESIIRTAAE